MLKVILGREVPIEFTHWKQYLDCDLYVDIRQYHTILQVAQSLSEHVNDDEQWVLHTFNPLLLNYFEDAVAIATFVIDRGNGLEPFFNETNKARLHMMGPGEVVVDSVEWLE